MKMLTHLPKRVCFAFSLLLFSYALKAQTTYSIPSSSCSACSNGAYGPVDVCDGKYTAEADIFPSSSLTYGTVSKLAYYQLSGSASSVPIKVYMLSTSASTFSSTSTWSSAISSATLVYSGNVSFNSTGWSPTITLNTSYVYSSGNLEVLIETDMGSTNCTGNPIFAYYTASGNSDQFWEGTTNSSSALQSETGVVGDQPSPIQLTITACSNPSISTQPSSSTQTICQSGSATALSVSASGTSLTFQWYKNTTNSNSGGTSVSGATSSSYTPATSTAGTSYYYCIVSSLGCNATSSVSGSIVINSMGTISSQSTGTQTLCQGSTPSAMSVTATGTSLTYQWYSNISNSNSGGTSVSGATSSSYTPSTTNTGTLYYYCIVSSNGGCPLTSAVSGAIIVNGTAAPTGTTPQVFCSSSNFTIASLVATGTSIQWYAVASGGTALAGTTALTGGTTYYASQTVSGCESVTRHAVVATINNAPLITSQSTGPQSVCEDSAAVPLSITATGTSLTYQWYVNIASLNTAGTAISGATASSYTPLTTTADTKYYYCVIGGTAPCTAVTSSVSGPIVSYLCNITGITAGGDLSGTYPNPTVAKINGMAVPTSSTGYLFNNGSGTLSWSEGGIWAQNGTNLFYNGGNVGIGTNTPKYPLEVYGNIASSDSIFGVDIFAQNNLSVGNFKFSNGSFVGAPDSITSKAPKLALSAQKLSLVADSVSMPGLVNDSITELMSIDKKGNLKPITSSGLQGLLYSTQQTPCDLTGCSANGEMASWYYTPSTSATTQAVCWTDVCEEVGVGTTTPDASLTIGTSLNGYQSNYSFSIQNTVNPCPPNPNGGGNNNLQAIAPPIDVFTVDGVGNTVVGGTFNMTNGGNNVFSIDQQGNTYTKGNFGMGNTTPHMPYADFTVSPINPAGGLVASFENGAYATLITANTVSAGYNLLTQPGDNGIFWSNNASNASNGFVIAPWGGSNPNSPTGIRITSTGQVGIDIVNPDAAFSISNPAVTNQLSIYNTTSKSDLFTVDQNGNTQIGLNSGQNAPDAALTICSPSPTGFASNQISVRDPNNTFDVFSVTNGGVVYTNGSIGVGIQNPNYPLDVIGIIHGYEVNICNTPGCDFVFDENYKLLSLDSLNAYLKLNHHLPEIKSAKQMADEGSIDLGEMDKKLLQKVEELTLYIIQQQQKTKEEEKTVLLQNQKIQELEEKINALIKPAEAK